MTKLQAWFHVNAVVLSCKTWNVVKSGVWLAGPLQGLNNINILPLLSKVPQVLSSQQAGTHSHSQLGQCPAKLEARSEACSALSLKPNQDCLFSFPNNNSLQCSYLENPMGRGTWWAIVHGFTKSQTQLSD